MYIIYKHDLNGKSYIGYTNLTMEDRLHKHYLNAMSGIDTHFYRAIRKYGIDSIKSTIVCECESFDDAKNKEILYISKYDTYNNGYNMTIGGDGGNICGQLPKDRYEKYIQLLIKRTTLDKNPNYSGYSDDELINFGVECYKKNNCFWSITKWYEYSNKLKLPKSFSKNRFNGGGFKMFKQLIANRLGITELNKYQKTEEHKKKLSKASGEWYWYTDGNVNKRVHKDGKPPKNFYRGRVIKKNNIYK
jgi:hypothetical protein